MEHIRRARIEELVNKTIVSIEGMDKDSKDIYFRINDGSVYHMYHEQDCCEDVWLEDVAGNAHALIATPILKAEELTHHIDEGVFDSQTYTFYLLATVKGYVTLRWCGVSNGYYSEAVDLEVIS